jgi:hypothetical protein
MTRLDQLIAALMRDVLAADRAGRAAALNTGGKQDSVAPLTPGPILRRATMSLRFAVRQLAKGHVDISITAKDLAGLPSDAINTVNVEIDLPSGGPTAAQPVGT